MLPPVSFLLSSLISRYSAEAERVVHSSSALVNALPYPFVLFNALPVLYSVLPLPALFRGAGHLNVNSFCGQYAIQRFLSRCSTQFLCQRLAPLEGASSKSVDVCS